MRVLVIEFKIGRYFLVKTAGGRNNAPSSRTMIFAGEGKGVHGSLRMDSRKHFQAKVHTRTY